jgi:hypothetical protein
VVIRVAVLVLALGGIAHADNPKLAAARRAIEDVRYDDARGLLVEALDAGTNRPDEMLEIYQLSAQAAVVLGQRELAEQYYRRMLALDPRAKLPADASPKLRPPFVAAQAYMAAQGRLDAYARRRGKMIEVTTADPIGMVAAVAAIVDGAPRSKVAFTGGRIALAPTGIVERLVLLDEHGNTLRVIAAPAVAGDGDGDGKGPRQDDRAPAPSLVRSWVTWAIPATALAATGVGFLVAGQRAKGRLDDILASNQSHFFDDAEQQRERWKTDTVVSNLAFAAAGAFAVTALVVAATRPSSGSRATVTATVAGHRVGLALAGKF